MGAYIAMIKRDIWMRANTGSVFKDEGVLRWEAESFVSRWLVQGMKDLTGG